MKFPRLILLLSISIIILYSNFALSQVKYVPTEYKNDPLGTKVYVLKNGLTVFLSVNKDEPRIATRIAVKTGSKKDPSDATGLAHYLEHMLFKGTDKFGTKNFDIEGKLIDEIISLYEDHRNETDPDKRKTIYHKIDSVSYIASGYAIPNEYDKMCASLGASGTNAYTSFEQTVYINEIPSNQLEKWLTIEAERFRNPVMRLFHTELEVVYEEKNRSMDNGSSKAFENLFSGLFIKHTYGTQTTIGTVEHLKNPSLKKVIDYYNTYYVPNNMAIILSGDFDPDAALKMIDEKFGNMQSKIVPVFNPPVEEPINEPVVRTVYSPDAENMLIGFRLPGGMNNDVDLLNMFSSILSNGTAGLIDLNIMKKQKALSASAYVYDLNDYSVLLLSAGPREGQTLEDVKELLLAQIELIKKGEFEDWYLDAVRNNYKLNLTKRYTNNNSRVGMYVDAFTGNIPLDYYLGTLARYEKIKKSEIVDFANRYFGNNYVVVFKKTGEDNSVQKIVKPELTPVQINRESESDMLKMIVNTPSDEISPKFIDYKKEISSFLLKSENDVYTVKNTENGLFELSFIFEFGNNADKKVSTAIPYLKLLGTDSKSVSEINEEFYKLACTYNVTQNNERIIVSLSGLNENFKPALSLLMSIFSSAKSDKEAYNNLIEDIIKNRANTKLNKNAILRSALTNYGLFGKDSPFTNLLSADELKNMNPEVLTDWVKSLFRHVHKVTYYGPYNNNELQKELYPYYRTKDMPLEVPVNKYFSELPTDENRIYFVHYNMKQVEILFLNRNELYNSQKVPAITLFNEYFGGGMSSIVFQELREAKALAYSVSSVYRIPDNIKNHHYLYSYIGTQSDKLGEALNGFQELLNNMPLSDITFNSAKDGVIKNIQSDRILRSSIINSYLSNKRLGIDYDFRKTIYDRVLSMSINDLKDFGDNYIRDKKYTYLVIGDRNKLDFTLLGKYGKVEELTLEQIFGY
jgi:predicted Zn-dependent peptidase